MGRATTLAITSALVLTGAMASTAHAGPSGTTELLSRPTGFAITPPIADHSAPTSLSGGSPISELSAGRRVVSANDRYYVFVSSADGMAPDDDDRYENVYVRDALDRTTTLVSRADGPAGAPANGDSEAPAISADGTAVAFTSRATNLFATDTAGTTQVYVRDLVAGTTRLVSRATGAAGVLGDDDSLEPSISGEGNTVAFSSTATNLGGGSGHRQVYARTGTITKLVSTFDTMTTAGNEDSFAPSVSDDGAWVAFTSKAQLVPGVADDNNAFEDVYERELATTQDRLVSRRPGGGIAGNGDSGGASVSADGKRVAFTSAAINFDAFDMSAEPDVYMHDFTSGATIHISVTSAPAVPADAPSSDASISAAGTKVSFATAATNLVAPGIDTNNTVDVYVRTLSGMVGNALASRCMSGTLLDQPAIESSISPSGTRVSYGTTSNGCSDVDDDDFAQVFERSLLLSIGEPTLLISRPTGTDALRSGANDSAIHGFSRSEDTPSSVSSDGRYTVFMSQSDELSPDDDNSFTNVYVRDALTHTTTLVSRASGADGAAADATSGPSLASAGLTVGPAMSPPAISANGRVVAFTSAADNLVPGDLNGRSDVFVRNLDTHITTLASVKTDGSQGPADSFGPALSADGNRVAFTSRSILDPADPDTDTDVYVRDIAGSTTMLMSRQNGVNGVDANDDASEAAISGDGNRVAFATNANNLVPALIDTNGFSDVYVRDIAAGSTSLVSARNANIVAGDKASGDPSLDATGAHISFSSLATNLTTGDGNGVGDVFVRDMSATPGTTTLISRGPAGFAGNATSGRGSISADGTRVAFRSFASDLFAGDTDQQADILLRDLTAGTTRPVSVGDGPTGTLPNSTTDNPSLSADGRCVVFDSRSDNLVDGTKGTDFIDVYMRAIDGDCGFVLTPPPPPGVTPDTTKPVITKLSLTHTKFKLATKKTASVARAKTKAKKKPTPAGTTVTFTLSEKAAVTIVVEQKHSGRKRKSTCVTGKSAPRRGARCTKYTTTLTLKRTGKAGANSVSFTGRVGSKKLAAGSYRFAITATDAAKNTSSTHRISFTVVSR